MDKWKQLSRQLDSFTVVELSHRLEEHIPIWPTHSKFLHTLWHSYWHGDEAIDYQLLINEHNGTHVDAPAHFMKEGDAHIWIDELSVQNFYGPCVVLDLSYIGAGGLVEEKHLREWEEAHGTIEEGDIVLLNLGWAKYWRNRPDDREYVQHWPGVGKSAAEYVANKKIKMIGVDTLAIDVYGSADNPAHHTLLGSKIPIVENLRNLDKMSLRGFFMALPLLIKGGSASPIRAIGFRD